MIFWLGGGLTRTSHTQTRTFIDETSWPNAPEWRHRIGVWRGVVAARRDAIKMCSDCRICGDSVPTMTTAAVMHCEAANHEPAGGGTGLLPVLVIPDAPARNCPTSALTRHARRYSS